MKKMLLVLLLSGSALAQQTGFSPTMPFGIPAHRTQSVVNSGGPSTNFPRGYNPYGYYYYYGGGGGSGYARSGYPTSQYGGSLPGYDTSRPSQPLPGYQQKPKDDVLPSYRR